MRAQLILIALLLPAGAAVAQETGTIRGRVTFAGAPPEPRLVQAHVNHEVCGSIPDQSLVVSPDRGLANAAVFLAGISERAPQRSTAVLGQKNCVFAPHVQTVTAGSELVIGNDDPIIHNVHARSEGETTFNLGMPLRGVKVKRKLSEPGVVEIRCDSGHTWMRAFVVVVPHSYHATSGPNGEVTIAGVAPGDYLLRVWHERLGVKETHVTVVAASEATFQIELAKAELEAPPAISFVASRAQQPITVESIAFVDTIASDSSGRLARRAADAAAGRPLFLRHCAPCHGNAGDGRGEAAAYLRSRPADFRKGEYKFRSTASGELPSELDLVRTISRGVPGTEMPAWGGRLSAGELETLARYLMTLSDRFVSAATPEELEISSEPPSSAEAIARGREIYQRFKCGQCHGDDGNAKGVAQDLRDDHGNPIAATDLRRGKYKSGSTPRDLYRTLMTGLSGTPMPAFAGSMSPEETWDLVHYVRSLAVPRDLERFLGLE